ncbi:MAG: hypothetical protein Q8O42_15480 [Acidobacteriota bacterium]|nr:hypothetical protein [Acidobacteriota bacterium]
MSSFAFLWPTAACVITGAALYVTRGVLDQTVTPAGVVRFAMLPPWQALLGFVCLAGLVLLGIDHLNAPRGTTTNRRPRLGELVLPLVALGVLIVPFLPVVPDRWPVFQALAGPLGAVVWLSVAGLQVWTLWQGRLVTARWLERWTLWRVTAGIGIVTAALATLASARLTNTPLFPSGAEPHYLVMAQSLWRDGDLRIENNTRGDYQEYFAPGLEPNYLARGADQEIYSIHPVGLPVLLAPVYAAGGYAAVVWVLILIGATAAAIAWWWTMATVNTAGAATFAWAAIAGTAPFLFNTFTVDPEIAAALAVMVALVTTVRTNPAAPGLARWLAVGVACAALPWLSTTYAPMSAALVVVAALRLKSGPAPLLRNPKVWAVVAPYALSLAGWSAFFYAIWGSPLPMAPYGALVQTSPLNPVFGAPGLFFDQEYGLLAFAPIYVLAVTGLYQLWRSGGESRRQALEIAIVFGALVATVGAFRIWWGDTSAPARPLASGLLLLSLPIATAFRAAPVGSARRAGQHLLLWISVGIALTLATAQDGLLINSERDGTSSLLEYWSPRWELWTLAPSFMLQPTAIAWLQTLWWVAAAAGAGWFLSRHTTTRPGVAALVAAATLGLALLAVSLTFPWLPAGTPMPRVDLGARSRLATLDGFDARVRPAAIIYDPLRKVAATEVLPQVRLGVLPGQRSRPQPVRVLHNGRFSLPAGTYHVDVRFNDLAPAQPTPFSLQVGRVGPPLQTWTLQPAPGGSWHTSVWLALDASFVGFRGPAEMEQAIASITITPTAVVDSGARPLVGEVLSAATYHGVMFYFHDEQMYPEPGGFWTIGRHSAEVTVAVPPERTAPVVLRIHGGAQANRAIITTFGWRRELALMPGEAAEVELPVVAGGVVPLTIATEDGFSPRTFDTASTDPRFLGIWVEMLDPVKEPS